MHAAVDPSAAATSHQLFSLLVIHLISLVSAHCAQHVQGLRKGDGDAPPPSGQLCSSPPKSKIQNPPPNFLFSPVHSFPSPSAPYHRLLRAGSWANTKLTPDVPTALASAQSRASKQAILQIAIPPQLQHSDLPLLLSLHEPSAIHIRILDLLSSHAAGCASFHPLQPSAALGAALPRWSDLQDFRRTVKKIGISDVEIASANTSSYALS